MAQMEYISIEALEDKVLGAVGTTRRDNFETQAEEEISAYHLGEAIKKAREAQNLTQEELGKRIGVQRAQISRLEKGRTFASIPTLSRVFTALGITSASLDLGTLGKVALW